MNMKSIPPTAPAEQVACGDAADGFQVKLIYPKPESIATRYIYNAISSNNDLS